MDIHEEDDFKLPDHTLQILNQFLMEKAKQDKEELFSENWNLSQFWLVLNFLIRKAYLTSFFDRRYSDETQKVFGRVVKNLLKKSDEDCLSIALLSCPSLFQTIRSINGNKT